MGIFLRSKLPWHSRSIRHKLGWLNWFWQFLCKGLSPFYLKGFYYSYACFCSLCEGETFFCASDSYLCFQQLIQCLTSFSSIDYLHCICSRFWIVLHLIKMRFSAQSTYLLIITYSAGTDRLVNSVIILNRKLYLVSSISNGLIEMVHFPT